MWFLTPGQRGNSASSVDDAHPQVAWTVGNTATPLAHGRNYFQRLLQVIEETGDGDEINFTDWRGDADERLRGPGTEVAHVLADAASRGVVVRGLIWRSHSHRFRFSKQENRSLADLVNAAGGEVFLDERVRRAGSHHQKLFVVRHRDAPDRDIAFVGGIDLCHGRNDDCHHDGDPQTISIDRRFGPRPGWHDMQIEIRGPAVDDLAETFRERWNDPAPLHGGRWRHGWRRLWSSRTPHPDGRAPVPFGRAQGDDEVCGAHAVQVLRTYPSKRPRLPFAPDGERSIASAYEKAFSRARDLIYIEDQYLWSLDAARILARCLRDNSELRVVAVVPRFPDDDGPVSGPPNRIAQLRAIRVLSRAGGERFAVYDLEGAHYPIYVHAKVCIVDDVWMTIGSDNLNRRSWTHDSEISCAVLDEERDLRHPVDPGRQGDGARVLARDTRLALWAEHTEAAMVPVPSRDGMELLHRSASDLDAWHGSGCVGPRPPGRLRSHHADPVPGWALPWSWIMYRYVSDPDGRPLRLRLKRSMG